MAATRSTSTGWLQDGGGVTRATSTGWSQQAASAAGLTTDQIIAMRRKPNTPLIAM